jgi:hypothetical protein
VLLHFTRGPSSFQACLKKGLTLLIFLARPDDPLRNIGKLNVEKPDRWYRRTELASCQRMQHDYHSLTPLSPTCLSPRAEISRSLGYLGNMIIASRERAAGSVAGYFQMSLKEHPN